MNAPALHPDLLDAARNLLFACGGLQPGDSVVICREDPALGWYDAGIARSVARAATRLGLQTRMFDMPAPGGAVPAETADLLRSDANLVFFARIGDHNRFAPPPGAGRRIMVYARDLAALRSPFGRTAHGAMQRLKTAMDALLFSAGQIEITCPNGTRMVGTARRAVAARAAPADVTLRRFPLGVPAPVPAAGFSGRVALVDALTPTGNRAYDPPVLLLPAPVIARIEAGRIVGFEGPADAVAMVVSHYRRIADHFGIDPDVVHSWHGGLHPGCRFVPAIGLDRDLWSNTVFSSPRLLHFHTCGTEAPGEISWNVVDPTVRVDGVVLVDKGTLRPMAVPALADAIGRCDGMQALFASPAQTRGT